LPVTRTFDLRTALQENILADQDLARRALASPTCWPMDEALQAKARQLGCDAPIALAGQVAGLTVSPDKGHERVTLWTLGGQGGEPGRPGAVANLAGSSLVSLERARNLLLNRFANLLGHIPLERANPGGRVVAAIGTPAPRIEGHSLGLALALSMLSSSTSVPLPGDIVAIAGIGGDGSLLSVDHAGLERKLELLERVGLGARRLLVSNLDAGRVDELTRCWVQPPEVLAFGSLNEVLDHVFSSDWLERDPQRPTIATLTPELRDLQQEWKRLEEFAERRQLSDSKFFPAFAPLFANLPLHDPRKRPFPEVARLVSLLGFSWQPAALLASKFRPAKMLLLGTRESLDEQAHGGQEPRTLVAGVSGLEPRQIETRAVEAAGEVELYLALREFLSSGDPTRSAVDITGGKKSMTAAAALVAQELGVPMVYVDYAHYDQQRRMPVPGTEFPRRLVEPGNEVDPTP